MDSKRGQFQIAFIKPLLLVVVVIAVLLAFLFSGTFRLTMIGLILVSIAGFVVASKERSNKATNSFVWILAIAGIGMILFANYGAISNAIFSTTTVQIKDGKAYWLISGTANTIDEGYTFFYNVGNGVNEQKLSDGKTITPQKSMYITISKGKSYCSYNLISKGSYDVLSNPSRVVELIAKDSNGVTKTIDGTLPQSITIQDVDGKGQVVIESQGILSAKQDCPESSNVAVIYKDGQARFVDKSKYEERTGFDLTSLIVSLFSKPQENTAFVSGFDSAPIRTGGAVTGNVNVGSVVFTLTADQDYFNSVVFTPALTAKPNIQSINLPSSIKQDSNEALSVTIKNDNPSAGLIKIKVTSVGASITPSEQSVNLAGTQTYYFNVRTISSLGSQDIKVEACGVSQFESVSCDTETKSFSIVASSSSVSSKCGDNVCQANENTATCSADCKAGSVDESGRIACEAKAQANPLLGYTWVAQKEEHIFSADKDTSYCSASYVKWYIISAIIIIGGIVLYFYNKPKTRSKRR